MSDTSGIVPRRAKDVPLHTTETFNEVTLPVARLALPSLARTRVPGGWLYSTYDYTENEQARVTVYKTTTFVPLSPDDEEGAP